MNISGSLPTTGNSGNTSSVPSSLGKTSSISDNGFFQLDQTDASPQPTINDYLDEVKTIAENGGTNKSIKDHTLKKFLKFITNIVNEHQGSEKNNKILIRTIILAINIVHNKINRTLFNAQDKTDMEIDQSLLDQLTKPENYGRKLLEEICKCGSFMTGSYSTVAKTLLGYIDNLQNSPQQIGIVILNYLTHIINYENNDTHYNFALHSDSLNSCCVGDLRRLNPADLSEYNKGFKNLTGYTPLEFAQRFPVKVIYNLKMKKMAETHLSSLQSFDNESDMPLTEEYDLKYTLCASSFGEFKREANKHGSIVLQPTPFVFGRPPIEEQKMVFGELIDVVGIPTFKDSNQAYQFYHEMYKAQIQAAVENKLSGSNTHLILNGVGDGKYAQGKPKLKGANSQAMMDAIKDLLSEIKNSGLKISLIDFQNKYYKPSIKNFTKEIPNFICLSGEDADIQGISLAKRVENNEFVMMTNASDPRSYGATFMSNSGDYTIEERIRNQVAPCLQYDVRFLIAPETIHVKFTGRYDFNPEIEELDIMLKNRITDKSENLKQHIYNKVDTIISNINEVINDASLRTREHIEYIRDHFLAKLRKTITQNEFYVDAIDSTLDTYVRCLVDLEDSIADFIADTDNRTGVFQHTVESDPEVELLTMNDGAANDVTSESFRNSPKL